MSNTAGSVLYENGRRVSNFTGGVSSSNSFDIATSEYAQGRNWENTTLSDKAQFIPYGRDNQHPNRLREIQKRSLQHSNIVGIASSLIAGSIKHKFKDKEGDLSNEDEAFLKEVNSFYKQANILRTQDDRAYNLYAYGYAPTLVNWQIKGNKTSSNDALNQFEKVQVSQRSALDFRLGRHYNTFFGLQCKNHYYHYDWTKVPKQGELSGIKSLTPNAYFRQSKVDHKKILKAKCIDTENKNLISPTKGGMYSYLIGMPKRSNKFYPRPFFESDTFWHKAYGEYELTTVERNGVKNGLRSDYIITVYRRVYDNPEGIPREQINAQKEIDLKKVEGQYTGYLNSGRTQVNFMGITHEDKLTKGEGSFDVDPIPNNNNFIEISARQQSLDRYIRSAHSLTVPEIAGLNDSKSGFSNIAEFLRVGAEVYVDNVIMPHIKQIDKWHNDVINTYSGFEHIETFTEPRVIALRALIQEFKEQLTTNEIRRDILGKGPLTTEDKTELSGRANKSNAQQFKSLDAATIQNIALAVKAVFT